MKKHTILHHLVMVLISEVNNFIWLFTAIVVAVAGFAMFGFSGVEFFKLAVGLPLFLIGVTVVLFKVNEIILVIARPRRLKMMCIFCQPLFKLPKKRKDANIRKNLT